MKNDRNVGWVKGEPVILGPQGEESFGFAQDGVFRVAARRRQVGDSLGNWSFDMAQKMSVVTLSEVVPTGRDRPRGKTRERFFDCDWLTLVSAQSDR